MFQNRNFACMINNSNEEQESPDYSNIDLGRLQMPQFMKILIYIRYISKIAILMKFFVILPDMP